MEQEGSSLTAVEAQRAACRRYQQSEKGRAAYKRANAKYRSTEAGKETMRESKRRWRQQIRERKLMEEALRQSIPIVQQASATGDIECPSPS